MELYRVETIDNISDDLLVKLIERYQTLEIPRLEKLERYYKGDNDINNRPVTDPEKPNIKISNPFASYISDTIQGYLFGKAVSYESSDDKLIEVIQDLFDNNHEQTLTTRIGLEVSKKGIGYELLYLDETGAVKQTDIKPENVFLIYDTTVNNNVLMGVRFYTIYDYLEDTNKTMVEIYDSSTIRKCELVDEKLKEYELEYHFFNGVPIIPYRNNDDLMGDYEKVIGEIDAYDLATSDTSNNLEYFADSYLHLNNFSLNPEKVGEMKQNRVLITKGDGSAQWLTKQSDITESLEHKRELKEDIHNFSFVPNLNDDSFGSATSGEGLKYKLFGLENMVANKERYIRQAIEKRIKLIVDFLNLKGAAFDHTDITFTFTRNLPSNNVELSDLVVKLHGILPEKTLLSLLPFIDDVNHQLKLKEQERTGGMYNDLLDIPEVG